MLLEKKTKETLLDGFLLMVILLLFFTNWIQFPFKLPLCALIIMAVSFYKRNYHIYDLGFSLKITLWKTFSWASLIVLIATFVIPLLNPLLENLFGKADYSGYGALKGNKEAVTQLWIYAMISAAFAEEVIFRGYFCSLFQTYIGTSQLAKVSMVIIGALLFTFAHYSQGVTGLINIFMVSILFYTAFVLSGRNIYAIILAHATIDTIGLYQLYLGNY